MHAKSQHEPLCIPVYAKKTKSNKLYSVNFFFIDFVLLCSLEYKVLPPIRFKRRTAHFIQTTLYLFLSHPALQSTLSSFFPPALTQGGEGYGYDRNPQSQSQSRRLTKDPVGCHQFGSRRRWAQAEEGYPAQDDGSPEPAAPGVRPKVAGDNALERMPGRRVATVGSKRCKGR
jgi:hypothetical protein